MDSYSVQAVLTLKDRLSSGMRSAASATSSLGSKMSSMVGVGAAMQVGMSAVSGAMRTMTSHIGDAVRRYDQLNNFPKVLKNLGVETGEAQEATTKLKEKLEGLPTTLNQASMSVQRFTSKNRDVGKSTDYFLAMNNAILAGGASAERQSSAIEQLSQAYSRGQMEGEEWKTLMEVMPGQLDQVAQAMDMTSDQLGEGLRNGTISMDDFMDTVVKLNKEGIKGYASFEKQAKDSISGIGTATVNLGTKISAGIANVIGAIDENLASANLPTIGESIILLGEKISDTFTTVSEAIKKVDLKTGIKKFKNYIYEIDKILVSAGLPKLGDMLEILGEKIKTAFSKASDAMKAANIEGIIRGLTPAFKVLGAVIYVLGSIFGYASKMAGKFIGFLNRNAEVVTKLATGIIGVVLAFKLFRKVNGFVRPMGKVNKTLSKTDKAGGKAASATDMLKNSLSGLAKMAGVAMMIGSIALLAKSMTGLGKLGTDAIAPIVTFGAVVGGLAVVFDKFGSRMQTNAVGIAVFAVSLSALAIAMEPIANAGANAATNMSAFGLVVSMLVGVFALFGSALTAALPGVALFTVAVLGVGIAMRIATPFVTAMTKFIRTLGNVIVDVFDAAIPVIQTFGIVICSILATAGNAIVKVAQAFSKGFSVMCDGVSTVIDAISGGLSDVLDSLSGVIESVGTAARNAGTGFQLMADGVAIITGLNLLDMSASLAAVATGAGAITLAGAGIGAVAAGFIMLASGLGMVEAVSVGASNGIIKLKNALAGFVLTPPATGAFIAAFGRVKTASLSLVPALKSSGVRAGAGLSSGLSSGCAKAASVTRNSASKIAASMNELRGKMESIGKSSGNGYASAMASGFARAKNNAKRTASQIVSTLRRAQSGASSAGRMIGIGLASGMRSALGQVRAAAAQLAAAADKAIRKKAEIRSPSKVTRRSGAWTGKGYALGILDKVKEVRAAASQLFSIPNLKQPSFAYAGDLGSDDYYYGSGGHYTIEVPVNIDGREVSRATASYMQEDIEKISRRDGRKKGRT